VVGASMGGMIAQTLAARHPARVRSLVSVMSSTGGRWVGRPALSSYAIFLRRAPSERAAFIAHAEGLFAKVGSRGFPQDSEGIRRIAALSFDRELDRSGSGRQLAAIIASGDRTAELARITAPTLVIHGSVDPLISPSGGRATARAIPGARLEIVEGLGHDLPRVLWPRLIDAFAAHAGQERARRSKSTRHSMGIGRSCAPRRCARASRDTGAADRAAGPPASARDPSRTTPAAGAPAPASAGRDASATGDTASDHVARGASAAPRR